MAGVQGHDLTTHMSTLAGQSTNHHNGEPLLVGPQSRAVCQQFPMQTWQEHAQLVVTCIGARPEVPTSTSPLPKNTFATTPWGLGEIRYVSAHKVNQLPGPCLPYAAT